MKHACSHCGEDLGELTQNAEGLAGALTVRVLTVNDGAVRAKCRRCSKWTDLPLRVVHHEPEKAPRRVLRVTQRPAAVPA